MKLNLPNSISVLLRQVPGKLLTVLGPLTLYWTLPVEQYAIFEACFGIASIIAVLAAGGLSSALPFDELSRGGTSVQIAMRRRLLQTYCTAAMALAGLVAVSHVMPLGEPAVRASLVLTLACGLVGQTYAAAILRLRRQQARAAICEHSGWFAALIAAPIAASVPLTWCTPVLVALQVANVLVVGLLLRRVTAIRGSANTEHRVTAIPPHLHGVGTPFVLSQLANVGALSGGRIVFLLTGHALASAESALAFRCAGPAVLVYQVLYASFLHKLFVPDKVQAEEVRYQAIVALLWGSAIVQVALGFVWAWVPETVIPFERQFMIAVFLAVQMVTFNSCCELLVLGEVGGPMHRCFAKCACIGSILTLLGCVLATLVMTSSANLVVTATAIGWSAYAVLACWQARAQLSTLNIKRLTLQYCFVTLFGGAAMACGWLFRLSG